MPLITDPMRAVDALIGSLERTAQQRTRIRELETMIRRREAEIESAQSDIAVILADADRLRNELRRLRQS